MTDYNYNNTIKEYLIVIIKRKWLILQAIVITTLIAAIYSFSLKDIYKASATLLLRHKTALSEAVMDFKPPIVHRKFENIYTAIEVIKSKSYLEATYKTLMTKPEFKKFTPEIKKLSLYSLMSGLTITPVSDTGELLKISFLSYNPGICVAVVNAYLETVIKKTRDINLKAINSTEKYVLSQLEIVKKKLHNAEKALKEFREKNRVLTISSKTEALIKKQTVLEMQKIEKEVELKSLLIKLKKLKEKLQTESKTIVSSKNIKTNPELQKLKAELVSAEINLATALTKYGNKHPKVINLKSEISFLKNKIKNSVKSIVSEKVVGDNPQFAALMQEVVNSEVKVHTVNAQIESFEKRLNSLKKAFSDIPQKEMILADLQRQVSFNEEIVLRLEKKATELRILKAGQSANFEIIDKATMPDKPIGPKRLLNIVMGIIGGLILGLIFAYIAEYFTSNVESPEHASKALNLKVLGIVPLFRKKLIDSLKNLDGLAPELISIHKPRAREAEAYRILRTNIQFSKSNKPLKIFLVTSALPKEGKSLTVANLGVSFAMTGKPTLIIDSDLRRPSIHRFFSLPNTNGFTNILQLETLKLEEYLYETRLENLFILPSGPIAPNPAELLHSDFMKKFITHIKTQFAYIIMDSPPVISVADSTILSNLVEGVLFVVNIGKTPENLMKKAKENLEHSHANIIGLICNKFDIEHSYYSNSYYYYYYNYSYEEESEDNV